MNKPERQEVCYVSELKKKKKKICQALKKNTQGSSINYRILKACKFRTRTPQIVILQGGNNDRWTRDTSSANNIFCGGISH